MLGPIHYRYTDEVGPEGVTINIEKWFVCGETPQCWYVIPEIHHYMIGSDFYASSLKNERKRISKYPGGKKRCYETLEEAWRSYSIRKRWQIRHTENSFQRAKTAIEEIGRLSDPPADGHVCQGGDFFKKKSWDWV